MNNAFLFQKFNSIFIPSKNLLFNIFLLMKSKEPLSIVLVLKNNNRRFFSLAQDFFKCLSPFCISGLTKNIEKLLCINLKTIKLLKSSHIWIFSQCRLSMFIHFSSIFSNHFLSFEIMRFALKKEFFKKSTGNKVFANTFLFLNNISLKSDLGVFLSKQLRKIVPVETNAKKIIENISKCILFDFNDSLKIMEFRCYAINNNYLLLSRRARKLKKLKKINQYNNKHKYALGKFKNNLPLIKRSGRQQQQQKKNTIRIIEMGPRFTTKILNLN